MTEEGLHMNRKEWVKAAAALLMMFMLSAAGVCEE